MLEVESRQKLVKLDIVNPVPKMVCRLLVQFGVRLPKTVQEHSFTALSAFESSRFLANSYQG